MTERPTSLFRGSELSRLLILLAIVIAGWSTFLFYDHSEEPPPPRPAIVPATKLTPIVPETGIEFQAIQDKQPILGRETAAYAILLQRARETTAVELAKQSRRDVSFTHVWERPEKYRGVPVHLHGTAKRIITYEVEPTLTPAERLYEVWFYTDDNRSFPNVVVLQDPPAGLLVGDNLDLRVTVDAYFMKLMKYRAGDTWRAAPLFVGRMSWTPTPVASRSYLKEFGITRFGLATSVFILALAWIGFRVMIQIRRSQAMARPRSRLTSNSGDLPPEQLVDWLNNMPEDLDESESERPLR